MLPAGTKLTQAQQDEVAARLVGRCIQKSQLPEMAQRVRDAYQNFGYYEARVLEPELVDLADGREPGSAALTFRVEEGPQFRLRKIEFRGVTAFQPEEIWALSPLTIDEVFDTRKVRDLLDHLQRAYAAKGYARISVFPDTRIAGTGIELTLVVDENASRATAR